MSLNPTRLSFKRNNLQINKYRQRIDKENLHGWMSYRLTCNPLWPTVSCKDPQTKTKFWFSYLLSVGASFSTRASGERGGVNFFSRDKKAEMLLSIFSKHMVVSSSAQHTLSALCNISHTHTHTSIDTIPWERMQTRTPQLSCSHTPCSH